MRVLYKRTEVPVPDGFVPSEVQKDILDNWKFNYNAFSLSQIADRDNVSRQHVRRKVQKLIKLGLVERHVPDPELVALLKEKNIGKLTE